MSYTFIKNDSLYGRDRDYIRNVNYSTQPYQPRDLTCSSPNLAVNTVIAAFGVTIASANYAAPGYARNTFNRCDNSDDRSFVPRAERHGAIAGLTQKLGEKTAIDIRAYYGQRKTESSSVLTGTVAVAPNNPYNAANLPAGLALGTGSIAIPGLGAFPTLSQAAVNFSLKPVYRRDSGYARTSIKEWEANAEIKHDLDDNWQLRALLNWSESDSRYALNQLSTARLAAAGFATTTATAINPYNVAQTNRALLDDLIDSEVAGQAKDTLLNARLIADGRLLALPGSDVRLAVGYEFMHDNFKQRFQSDLRAGTLGSCDFYPYKRSVHSLFGELLMPVFGEGNRSPGSIRLRSRLKGATITTATSAEPSIRSSRPPTSHSNGSESAENWGTSFTAPTPLDQLGSLRNTVSAFPFVAFTRPGETPPGGSFSVALQGSQSDLKPQTADTWSVGVDLDPLQELRASVSYYDVNFKNILVTPTPNVGIFTEFPSDITTSTSGISAAQLRAFGALATGGASVVGSLIASGTPVYELVDFRVGNFGVVHVKGLDFSLNYRRETGFGSVYFDLSGNAPLSRKAQVSATSAVVDQLARDNPKLFLQTTVGATFGSLRAQATWKRNGGYDIVTTSSISADAGLAEQCGDRAPSSCAKLCGTGTRSHCYRTRPAFGLEMSIYGGARTPSASRLPQKAHAPRLATGRVRLCACSPAQRAGLPRLA